ncbi:MAG: uroporphyrinogen decarboxylase family protein [Bacillota bacterium]|nr:uroporphyrinogen decarboxylase family protein [Bacillota bacterium]
MFPESWQKLSAHEKYEERFKAWISPPNVRFANPEVEKSFKQRVQRIKDVVELKKPDRIPVCPNIGFFPAKYAGITAQEAMYDYQKLGAAWKKYHQDFLPDSLASCMLATPGKVFEILDYRLYRWPGRGTPPDTPYQCVEAEYMREDEYDALIRDPSAYWMRVYLPRVFGALEAWGLLPPFTDVVEMPFTGAFMVPIGMPQVQRSFEVLLEAGRAAVEWVQAAGAVDAEIMGTLGVPSVLGGFSKAPFDTLGDTLRGTRGIMLDIYRRPGKLLEALERLVPVMVELGVRTAAMSGNPMVFIPLHKGADGFLSRENFSRFYWPTLKAVLLGLIDEGLVPWVFVEGSYNQRLDFLADRDLPPGRIVWMFDQTDMVRVKEMLGGVACFAGNVPVTMLKAGTPEEVRRYVRDLIEKVAQDGGFILATGGVVDDAEPESFRAMIEAGKEYGVYR